MVAHTAGDLMDLVGEPAAALVQDVFQLVHGLDGAIGNGLAKEGPESLRWLELGGIGREEQQTEALGKSEVLAHVPAGPIDHQQDPLVRTQPQALGEQLECDLEDGRVDRRQEQPEHLACGRSHEAEDIEPLVATATQRNRTLTTQGPDATDNGNQPEPRLVLGPELDFCLGVSPSFGGQLVGEFFLKDSCSPESASTCRGRGLCVENPRRPM
jgi:hypothetical protein